MTQSISDPNGLEIVDSDVQLEPEGVAPAPAAGLALADGVSSIPMQARGDPNGEGTVATLSLAPPDVAEEQASAPPIPIPRPIPVPIPIRRKTVSGRYRSSTVGFQLELRVDVDGATKLNKVSGDYYSVSGSTTAYFGSWRIAAPTVSVSATTVTVEGIAECTWNTAFTKARITIPRVLILQPQANATLTWFNAAGAQGATYVCAWESSAFRTIQWEQDSVTGTVPFVSYDTGSLPQPASSPARTLSVVTAFAEARIQLLTAGAPNVITNALAGADARWDEAELHAAMQANFSLWANVPQWKVYTLVATKFAEDGVRGIMYDASGVNQRQGMAVFYDAIKGADAATQRAQLRTYVHELGHCFNLLHSWQKGLAQPPQPLGPNGGLGDLSWMNYAWKFQPPAPAPGGEAAYWAAFPFQFTASELAHLRHAMRGHVIMGGNAFGTNAAEVDPLLFADREVDNSDLALELKAERSYLLGAPVVVELKLSSTSRKPVRTHGRLHPRDGLVHIAVQEPSGRVKAYRPLMPRCADDAQLLELDEQRPSAYESAYIGYGQDGFTFEQIGTYRLRAVYVADDGSSVVSPTLTLRVRSPLSPADEEVADLFTVDGQGELLYLLGSDAPALAPARAAMDEVLDRHPDHPLAVFARLVQGVNDERTFKTVTSDKTLELRSARTDEAVGRLGSVIEASSDGGGVDNITLNLVMRRLARAEAKAGDVDKATATLQAMPRAFADKGVKPSVVKVIATQAKQEKARLLHEVLGQTGDDGER
ncbi:hypothetical protein [Motilibacter deserti]|uniref:Uncharacterized protein n=1 Tax=Motilibacter deserti TaxID=2714956 RepID=A0ABX0GXH8_9ACTN|nr:hypothetical protein [Motilibacter deserti]NHC14324.1 hypothetical protein [Motilibacter deserti]